MSRILVVEDDAAILRGLTDSLEAVSHEVLTARDGEAGYRLLVEEVPDLVILDVMLPKVGGFELCKRAREEARPRVGSGRLRDQAVFGAGVVGEGEGPSSPRNAPESAS